MTTSTSVEGALLARLGLPAKASSQEVEAAHDGLVDFLEGAPADLRPWARVQIGSIDEAFALLSDPTIDRSALGNLGPAPVAAATQTAKAKPARRPEPIDDEDLIAEFTDDPAPARAKRGKKDRATTSTPVAPTASRRPLIRRIAVFGAVVVGVVAIAIAGFNLNGGTGIPPINGTPAPVAAASDGPDAAQISALMQKIQADPKDVASLQSLADLYYQAGDYTTSGTFLEKVLALDPKNMTGLLALGAVQFNRGNPTEAAKNWRAALLVDPKSVEAHYDLGFMYLSQNPPDMANVKLEWGKVVELDPNSSVAKTVATHLASLASAAPGASAAPSTAPSAAASPTPAASPAPSGK